MNNRWRWQAAQARIHYGDNGGWGPIPLAFVQFTGGPIIHGHVVPVKEER